jgi:hypothetical protein
MEFGFHRCQTDHSTFHLHTATRYIILVVYVDDIMIAGSGQQNHQAETVFTVALSHQRSG